LKHTITLIYMHNHCQGSNNAKKKEGLKCTFHLLSFKKLRLWPPMKKMTKVTPCLGNYALLTPNIREIWSFDPLSSQKVAIMALFWDTWRLLNIFETKGAKLVIFSIGDQNRNFFKFGGRKVQFCPNNIV